MKFPLFFFLLGTLPAMAQNTPPTPRSGIFLKKTDSLWILKNANDTDSLLKLSQNKIPNRLPNNTRLYTVLKKTEMPKNLVRIQNLYTQRPASTISVKPLSVPQP